MQNFVKIISKYFSHSHIFLSLSEPFNIHRITVLFLRNNERDFKNLPSGRNT